MKRIVAFVLCLAFVFSLSSCDENATALEAEKIIAVEYASANQFACEEYISDGYTKVTYNSPADVVLAVENGKAGCGILDEFELYSFEQAGRNVQQKEICEYSIDYCAYFSSENQQLQEAFNDAIEKLNADGTIDKIKNAHLSGMKFSREKSNNENGTLTMICDPNFENRVYTDDNGEITGLDVDIAYEICSCLGYDLEIVTADFDELFIKLDDGEGDFIISACEVNEDRAEYYLLSDIYFTLSFYLIERK